MTSNPHTAVRQYGVITANYWAFTLTDGALRMLVLLHFYELGYGALALALLFVFYEFFGVVTNLVGGWLGARWGLNKTMHLGVALQLTALAMLTTPLTAQSVVWVMAAQALSGIAKDLNKMSAKSSLKLLLPAHQSGQLFRWVALLTGSKNTLKGVGFFAGGLLLTQLGFSGAIVSLLLFLTCTWAICLLLLGGDLGKATSKAKFKHLFSPSKAVNLLAAARLFLFGARDLWFAIALPVYLAQHLNWSHSAIGSLMACWIIGYGIVQSGAPWLLKHAQHYSYRGQASFYATTLAITTLLLAVAMLNWIDNTAAIILGLAIFAAIFAINSSLHSFLIVHYARRDGVSMEVGFYYMANAMGRLVGTLLSGWIYQRWGFVACLFGAAAMVTIAAAISLKLPATNSDD